MSADWAQHAPRPGHACVCGWAGTPGAIEQLADAEWRAHIGADAMPAEPRGLVGRHDQQRTEER